MAVKKIPVREINGLSGFLMKKRLLTAGAVFFVLFFSVLVYASNWDDINSGDANSNANNLQENVSTSPKNTDSETTPIKSDFSKEVKTKWTFNFFLAIIAIVVGVLILAFIVVSLFLRPKNRWEK